jgi:NADH-ubiquinone oxidoreductase chain 5
MIVKSQLGMMVIAIGLSCYTLALFHLINHAFYKGLLFLGAGAVIHAVADNQDFRKYGGLISFLPLTYSVILIASLSLVAFPFMTGFYSKDFILESAFGQYHFSSIAVYVIAVIGAVFTTLYSVKVLYLTFLASPNGSISYYKHAHEGDFFLSFPLVVLALFSIFFGFIAKDIYIGLGSSFFIDNSIFIHPVHEIMIDTEFAVPHLFKLLPFIFTIIFSILAIIFSEFLPEALINFKFSRPGYFIFGFFNQRFLVEMLYNNYITLFILNLGGQTTKVLDRGSIELIGPFGLEKGLIKLSKNISSLSTGIVTTYALFILLAFITLLLTVYLNIINYEIIFLGLVLLALSLSFNSALNVKYKHNNLQSKFISKFFTIKNALKHLTWKNVLVGISILCIVGFIRFSGLSVWLLKLIIDNPSELYNWYFTGLTILPVRLICKGIIEPIVDYYLGYDKMTMGYNDSPRSNPLDTNLPDSNISFMDSKRPSDSLGNEREPKRVQVRYNREEIWKQHQIWFRTTMGEATRMIAIYENTSLSKEMRDQAYKDLVKAGEQADKVKRDIYGVAYEIKISDPYTEMNMVVMNYSNGDPSSKRFWIKYTPDTKSVVDLGVERCGDSSGNFITDNGIVLEKSPSGKTRTFDQRPWLR